MLKTNRGLLKTILLSVLTLCIYPIVQMCAISTEINVIASKHDGKKTMFYLWILVLSPISAFIIPAIWFHLICKRMGDELERRGIDYSFGPADYWLWNILGSLILIGPLVFIHKQLKAMNLLCQDFNING